MYSRVLLAVFICWVGEYVNSQPALKDMPPCIGWPQEEIYCYGDLLNDVQLAVLYNDSKHYVDMSINQEPDDVLDEYNKLTDPDKDDLQDFVDEYYEGPGEEFEDWTPPDWHSGPDFIDDIADPQYQEFAEDLHEIWKQLGRKIKDDVKTNQQLYSLFYVDEPFVVPGGRFREFYYWDSYWVINGLLVSEMHSTVKGMLTNFVSMVDHFGFVPNGGRIYYTRRSQPPLLIPMVARYYNVTEDDRFVEDILPTLEKEYEFWMTNRTHVHQGHTLNQYRVDMGMPRPEAYKEDIETASGISGEDNKAEMYSNLASTAESGWDFSSRWMTGQLTLDTTRKKKKVPTATLR